MNKLLYISLLLCSYYLDIYSQEAHIIPGLDAEIIFDGMPDEKIWDDATIKNDASVGMEG